jgi:hypothetical protein
MQQNKFIELFSLTIYGPAPISTPDPDNDRDKIDGLGLFPVTMIRKSLVETLSNTYSQTAELDGDPSVLSHYTFLNVVKGALILFS